MSRFDYVKYDEEAEKKQLLFKEMATSFETAINTLRSPRSKALAITSLEECYMWIGKAIRDDQNSRTVEEALK